MNNPSNPNTNHTTINVDPVLAGFAGSALLVAAFGAGVAVTGGGDNGGKAPAHNTAAVSHPFASSTEYAPITSDTRRVTLPSLSASPSKPAELSVPEIDPSVKAAAERVRTSAKKLAIDLVTQMGDPRVRLESYHPGDIGNEGQGIDQYNAGNYSGASYRATYDKATKSIFVEGLFTPDLSHPNAEDDIDGANMTFDVSPATAQAMESKLDKLSPADFLAGLEAPGTKLNSVQRGVDTTLYVGDNGSIYVSRLNESWNHYLEPGNAATSVKSFTDGLDYVDSHMAAAFSKM